ncbi:MAG: hypothetical protein ABSG92_09530 [Conexivisphaerales archaeon]
MTSPERVRVYFGPGGETFEAEREPRSMVDVEKLRADLKIPSYVDLKPTVMRRAIVALWAATTAPSTFGKTRDRRKLDSPLQPLLMGGAAVKVLSASANEVGGPMNRKIHDLDFILPKSQAGKFVQVLSCLEAVAGSEYMHFLTSNDRRFNALRAGERYRARGIDWGEDGQPSPSVVDILVDRIEMRHRINVREEFALSERNFHTIGMEKLIISKCQLINEYDPKVVSLPQSAACRILRYPPYRKDRTILGMEEKDMLDVSALFIDGGEDGRLDIGRLRRALDDRKLLLTVRLNLENLVSAENWMKTRGLNGHQISRVHETGRRILSALPVVDQAWSKPWWNTNVETPLVT